MANGDIKAPEKTVKLINDTKSINMSSHVSDGWVFDVVGVDSAGKQFRIGFDQTGGIYCYYNGALKWNIHP